VCIDNAPAAGAGVDIVDGDGVVGGGVVGVVVVVVVVVGGGGGGGGGGGVVGGSVIVGGGGSVLVHVHVHVCVVSSSLRQRRVIAQLSPQCICFLQHVIVVC